MGKFQETVNFHKRLQRHQLITKKIPFPQQNSNSVKGDHRKKDGSSEEVNSKTKQKADVAESEVRIIFLSIYYFGVKRSCQFLQLSDLFFVVLFYFHFVTSKLFFFFICMLDDVLFLLCIFSYVQVLSLTGII